MLNHLSTASRILIVDDQPSNVMLLEGILEEENFTSYRSITDPRQVLPAFIHYRPDLVLPALKIPFLDAFPVIKQLRACRAPGVSLPILVWPADITPES